VRREEHGGSNGLCWATTNRPGRKAAWPHKIIGKERKEKTMGQLWGFGPRGCLEKKSLFNFPTPFINSNSFEFETTLKATNFYMQKKI
jgi:hypothetical protein